MDRLLSDDGLVAELVQLLFVGKRAPGAGYGAARHDYWQYISAAPSPVQAKSPICRAPGQSARTSRVKIGRNGGRRTSIAPPSLPAPTLRSDRRRVLAFGALGAGGWRSRRFRYTRAAAKAQELYAQGVAHFKAGRRGGSRSVSRNRSRSSPARTRTSCTLGHCETPDS
jgi:hypothetical protein